jgi:rhodanese-related sulfurtransferase
MKLLLDTGGDEYLLGRPRKNCFEMPAPRQEQRMNAKHKISVMTVGVMALVASLSIAAETTKDSLQTVKMAIADKKAVLVDVREKSEWDSGHIEGAVFLPLSELQRNPGAGDRIRLLSKDKIIYTHCVVGRRAVTAGNVLEKLGYEVRCLQPGYKELIDAGFKKAKD